MKELSFLKIVLSDLSFLSAEWPALPLEDFLFFSWELCFDFLLD